MNYDENSSEFNESYAEFMEYHQEKRNGERLSRLQEGHGHAEKIFLKNVWWPSFGHFRHLHPEYQILDFKDGHRFLDFAYILPYLRIAFEIDGYGPHWRDISRWQFADQWTRQNHLIIDGWNVIRFTYDQVNEKPRFCQQMIQQFMGRWVGEDRQLEIINCIEQEIVRYALRLCRPVTPGDIMKHLNIGDKYARSLLHSLANKSWLVPSSGKLRIRAYLVSAKGRNLLF